MNSAEDGPLFQELVELLGEADFIRFVEAFAGCRVYFRNASLRTLKASDNMVLSAPREKNDHVAEAVGPEIAGKLMARYGGTFIRVPLARTLRAATYRAQGFSNGKIAVRLGMTETGVDKLFSRIQAAKAMDARRVAANDDKRTLRAANDDRPKRRLIRAAGDE